MAIVRIEDEEEQGAAMPEAAQGDGVMLTEGVGGAVGGGPGGAAGAAPQGASPGSSAGTYVSAEEYAQLNQPATRRLSERLAGQLEGAGQQARTSLEQGGQQFGELVQQGSVGRDDELIGQIGSDPVGLANDPDRLAQVTQARQAQYTGPAQLEDTELFSPIAAALGDASRAGELAGTSGGRTELLSRVSRPPGPGGARLDESLIQSDDLARGRVESARSSLGDLDELRESTSAAARQRASAARDETEATRQATQEALSQAFSSSTEDIERRLAEARSSATSRTAAAQAGLQPLFRDPLPTTGIQGRYSNELTGQDPGQKLLNTAIEGAVPQGIDYGGGDFLFVGEDERSAPGRPKGVPGYADFVRGYRPPEADPQALADLGITPEEYAQLFDISGAAALGRRATAGTGDSVGAPNPYYFLDQYEQGLGDLSRFVSAQSPDAQITRESVATPEDFARLEALNQLSGEQNLFLDPTQRDLAGTASADLVDFDLRSALQQRDAALRSLEERVAGQLEVNSRSGGEGFLSPKKALFGLGA